VGAVIDLARRRLYLCTPLREDLGSFLDAVLDGGVDVVQLRAKQASDRDVLAGARLCAARCAERGVPFILNDRADLALEVGADGVHVGQDDAPVSLVRRLLGPGAIIGLSTHEPAQLAAALGEDVNYLSAGPVEATPTKPGRAGTGVEYASEAVRRSPWPVFVTGGVSPGCVDALAAAGVRHFVVVRYLTEAADPREAARRLAAAIEAAIGPAEP
jgi:thiamine-phosphate pyrophosphorylase